nr:hypothetical protein GPVRGNEL_GPVRGNEL_CDS_0046 [Caudoviricetes sp.]
MAFTITKFVEWCPNCESENEFRSNGHKVYICQYCGYALAPCSLCEMDKARCSECEISKRAEEINKQNNF